MSEKKFLQYVLLEGILLISFGLVILLLPKISMLSFGFALCLSFIFWGGYKFISSYLVKNYSGHYFLDTLIAALLTIMGIILFFIPYIDTMLIIGLIGIYFILQGLSSSAFGVQIKGTMSLWKLLFIASVSEFLFGLVVIITLPSQAFWFAGVLCGLDFLVRGIIISNIYIISKYNRIFDQIQ